MKIFWWIIRSLFVVSIGCDIKGFTYPIGYPWLEVGEVWVACGQVILLVAIFLLLAERIIETDEEEE